jgi:hypothetical protein
VFTASNLRKLKIWKDAPEPALILLGVADTRDEYPIELEFPLVLCDILNDIGEWTNKCHLSSAHLAIPRKPFEVRCIVQCGDRCRIRGFLPLSCTIRLCYSQSLQEAKGYSDLPWWVSPLGRVTSCPEVVIGPSNRVRSSPSIRSWIVIESEAWCPASISY